VKEAHMKKMLVELPDDLHAATKMKALLEHRTIKEVVIEVLEAAVKTKGKKP
jgi:hypothetical protein